jgi:hypothetical protein
MKFWLDDTKELTNTFSLIPSNDMNNIEYYNTMTRITIIIGVLIFVIFRNKFILILSVVLIFIIIVKYKSNTKENYTNYNNEVLIKYPNNNLYKSDLLYNKNNKKCDYEISDRNNEINNPINININYYKYYNNRNNICKKNGFDNYNKYLNYLYPNRMVKYCKEGFQHNCFKVKQNYTPNYIQYQLN